MTGKDRIIEIFRENVKGRRPYTFGAHANHDGREGHWLEQQFGVEPNANNNADLYGYELKNQTTSKTTFGDWSANRYVFDDPAFSRLFRGNTKPLRQDIFVRIFGKPNPEKGGRYSWSGEPCPKIRGYNRFGQRLVITVDRDIVAIYDFNQDQRPDKFNIVPREFQNGIVELARWFGEYEPSYRDKCLKSKLEDKFNDMGWFTCKKGLDGTYQEICFGDPINFDTWIELVEQGIVFFDSGMYEGNFRPYSQWRSNNSFWDSLIVEKYV
ncbi:LlaMI family restriction endonuclease [Bacillus sp. AFS017274]|uniref:LlaMI family restriction endonuclease n=1 Tax=Bacillus sp. AFS017274 TaxID=2033488 RepID=UPI000BF4FC97|nr:LlaMI family restriction endonuclease [Bacillus sp. AFS017274]PEZ76372.1 restriction endonuclease [Bacillus sp. AFS017274]